MCHLTLLNHVSTINIIKAGMLILMLVKKSIYKCFKLDFCLENYLQYNFNTNILTKLRSGSLKLYLETSRYDNIPRDNRICRCCKMNNIEDEYHFVLICPAYRTFRCNFLPKYYCSWPNTRKLLFLLQAG